jgi:UDP-hydrolysing UDP-N-acetyl-D-glucosamine 2-epimerase
MGEDPARVFVVGAPGLDAILHGAFTPAEVLKERYSLDLTAPLVLCVQHPVSSETESAPAQMQETLAALTELKYQTIIIYPNADAGGRQMINVIRNYEKLPFIRSYKNIPHEDYLGLLRISSVLVGNSSSGIIEAPSFHVPVVNIGSRQQGRERGCNVTDTGYDRRDIIRAVRRSLHDEQYRKDVDGCCNPYGDGTASDKIIRFLKIIDLTNFDTQKQLQYD